MKHENATFNIALMGRYAVAYSVPIRYPHRLFQFVYIL